MHFYACPTEKLEHSFIVKIDFDVHSIDTYVIVKVAYDE